MSILLAIVSAIITVTFHVWILTRLAKHILRHHKRPVLQLNFAFLLLGTAHMLEIIFFGFVTWLACESFGLGTMIGRPEITWDAYLYFAFETYSTVGYGNVYVEGFAEALGAAAALVGIVMTASSASLTFLAIQFMHRKESAEHGGVEGSAARDLP
ncbi:MAG: ion channel [Planctomycetota bacterium]